MRIVSLQTKFLIGAVTISLFIGLALIVFVRATLYQTLDDKLEKRGVSIAKNIAQASIDPLLTEQYFKLEMMVKDYKIAEDDIEYIFIVNSQGEVIAHTFENGFPVDLKQLKAAPAVLAHFTQHLETENGIISDIAVPLLKGTAGTLHVGISEAPVQKGVNDIISVITWVIIAVLAAGCGIAVIAARAITNPVHALVAVAAAVENGDLSARVRESAKGEFGILTRAFNRMTEAREKAEADLRSSEKKIRDVTSHLAEGLYVYDRNGKIIFMNPEAERLLGWTMDELNEKGAHELIHFRRADGTRLPFEACDMHNVMNTGKRYVSASEVFVRKDGAVFPIFVVSSPIMEEGTIVASVTAFRDISQQKELEQDREQLIIAYQDVLDKVKTLKGLLPICASCKRIRDDKGYWSQIESYIHEHSDAEFSHGICPECAQKLYPEYYGGETCKDEP